MKMNNTRRKTLVRKFDQLTVNNPTALCHKPIAVAVSLALATFGAPSLSAQEAGADDVIEEIVVTGFRRSLSNSIALKQSYDSIVEAVSAEEIGKLPDVSIAESLARLPGLAAQRLNGRGQVISVRGLGPDFTTALLNGRQQVSSGDNRGVEFDQYPSELLSGALVYKTPDAGLIGQGLAGTVDLRTIRPLEHGRRSIAGNARYERNSIDALNAGSEDTGERFSLSYVDQFANDTVGFAIGLAHQSAPTQSEWFNAWGYPSIGDDLVIGGSKPYVQSILLERDGVIGVLEYQPTDRFSTAVDVYYSDFEETQLQRGIELPLYWGGITPDPGYTVENGLITNGTFDGVKGVVRNDINSRDAELWAAGWNAEWVLSDNWTAEIDINRSQVDRFDTILETYSGTGTAGQGATDTLGFTHTGEGFRFGPSLDYTDQNLIQLTSPQGWGGDIVPGGQLGYYNAPQINDELTQFQLSAERLMEGALSSIEFGVNLGVRDKSLDRNEFFLGLASGATSAPITTANGITDLSFLGIPGMISYDPLAQLGNGTYRLIANPNADVVIKSWEVEEDINLAYVKVNLDTQLGSIPVTGNFGVQIVDTDQSSTAFAASGTGADVTSVPINGGTSYTEVLPSVNLNFQLSEQNYVKVGLARTLARPRMDDLRASAQFSFDTSPARLASTDINFSPWSGDGGNPELRPWIADALDVSFERYFDDDAGYFAIAGFYKDLDTYVVTQDQLFDFTGFPTGGFQPQIFQGLVRVPVNGNGGRLSGFEVAASVTGNMLTPVLNNFGVLFSASFTDSDIMDPAGNSSTPIPGLSETVSNLTLYYENDNFSARISNRYRSEFLGEVSGFGGGRDLTSVEDESLVDAQISYSFNSGPLQGITLLLQGNNLTDEPFQTFYNGDSRQVRDFQHYGRTLLVGISYQYQ